MKKRTMATLPPLDVYFLPHILDFLKLIDNELGSYPKLVSRMADSEQIKAPHPQTLKKAEREPVTVNVASKIDEIWRSSLPAALNISEIESAAEAWRALGLKNNGVSWISGLAGLEQSKIGPALEKSRAIDFIRKRAEQEKSFLELLQERTQNSSGIPLNSELLIRDTQNFLSQSTYIDPKLISLMVEIDPNVTDRASEQWTWGMSILKLINHQLRVDFYYSFLCKLTLDVATHLAKHGSYETYKPSIVESGLAGEIAPFSAPQNSSSATPFAALLDVWLRRLSDRNQGYFSFRRMALFLPPPKGKSDEDCCSDYAEDPQERKYRWLKKWRNNGEVPKRSQLKQFISRLWEGDEKGHYLAWLEAQIALAWGQLIHEESEALTPIIAEYPEFHRFNALGNFSEYWMRYRDQAAKITAT